MTISDEEDEDYTPNGMMNGDDTDLSLRKGMADLLTKLGNSQSTTFFQPLTFTTEISEFIIFLYLNITISL